MYNLQKKSPAGKILESLYIDPLKLHFKLEILPIDARNCMSYS